MIQSLAGKYQKAAACILLSLFYSEFVLGEFYTPIVRFDKTINASYSHQENQFSFTKNYVSHSAQASFAEYTDKEPNQNAGTDIDHETSATKDFDDEFSSGPSQPEMQAFQSVNSNNMVDLFTGDFSYNIPLMDVGGYPVNIAYRSGVSMDQEASWVGLGWNINPGTITRNMRGLPDDFNGASDSITKTTSIKDNQTIGVTTGADLELVGFPVGVGASIGVFKNTYHGWGTEVGLNASIRAGNSSKGALSGGLGVSVTNNSQNGVSIQPSLSVSLNARQAQEEGGVSGNLSISPSYSSRGGLKALNFSTGVRGYVTDKITQTKNEKTETILDDHTTANSPTLGSSITFGTQAYTPTISIPYSSLQVSFTQKVGFEAFTVHPSFFVNGYYTSQRLLPQDRTLKLPAYGYLNYTKGSNNPSALLDFNREKEIPYSEQPPVPNIAVPAYTYDVFSITGEGTGGMFRPYRGDIGYMYDHFMKTKDESGALSLDFGVGDLLHFGLDLNFNSAYTQNSLWNNNNTIKDVVGFKNADSTYEPVYFRNPGEKTINSKTFYDAIGGDDVVTVGLYQAGANSSYIGTTNYLNRYKNKVQVGSSLLTSANTYKKERDKRSQVITYFTAAEASVLGMNKYIENFAVNRWGLHNCNKDFPSNVAIDTFKLNDTVSLEKRITSFRKANHISEIDVLNGDGRKYVYGIPVYNLVQREATFSIQASKGNATTGFVKYTPGTDDAVGNPNGMDNYYNSQEIPSYAHSFLLTSILSSDYVDLTSDGITDDDLGDAVKFNYSKIAGIKNPFKWRTPYMDSATYDEGLKTDNRDDKGSYVYGKKEIWYLNSIESKTMIATFTLEDRKDQLPVDSVGAKDFTNNSSLGTKRLKEINLYSKADFLKKGTNATPIKTVHFEYTYELCKGYNKTAGNSYDTGKLTLKKLWFSYNGNDKGIKNPYTFFYNSNNPRYNAKSYDRWGNYKDPANNAGGLSNVEFPYATQDSANANTNAAAWTMDSILLPSGGRLKVNYESDDYAYVQNKRAMQMFKVLGFATSSSGTKVLNLYNTNHTDNLFVFVHSNNTLANKSDVYYKYLEGVQKMYFKLFVKMPSDQWGNGSEYVPCYADLDTVYNHGGYDKVDDHTFWVKLKGINLAGDQDGDFSPLAKAAIQFLRLNLPSKAYPNSDVSNGPSILDAVMMVFTIGPTIMDALKSFDAIARANYWCTSIDTNRTFIRLDNPDFKKRGGGLRVKSIKIYDNWKTMTKTVTDSAKESIYGQEYEYTTTKTINGVTTTISSGVASYEPMIGGEENPFHQPVRFSGRSAPLGPVTLGYVEEPLGETFFPSADIGYSKVRIHSINIKNVKSANGYEETRFYTSYDFPTIVDNTMLDDNTKKRYKPKLANFLKIDAKHYLTMSQGFKVELNDMNGKIRSQATYPSTDSLNPISYTENFYKVDDQNAEFKHLANTVSVIDEKGNIDTTAFIGKDAELMMDMREQQSVTSGNNFNTNFDIFLVVVYPIFVPSLYYFPQHEEDLYRSIATTKIIQRYGILDSVIHSEKGSLVSTKNLLYDSETGDVLLTRTNNEFNDPTYNFTFPSHWAYSGMGMAYQNVNSIFTQVTIDNGIMQYSSKYPNLKSHFESGDEILALGRRKIGENTPVNCDGIQTSCPVSIFGSVYDTTMLWAVDAKKMDPSSAESLVFVEADGKAYSAIDTLFRVIRSGKRNMGMTPVGSVTCFNNPIKPVSGQLKIVLDSSANVVAGSAVAFTDKWRIDNIKKSMPVTRSCGCGPLKTLFDYLISSHRLFIQSSDGVTVDSIARAAGLSVSDCGLLSANRDELFYAITTDTADYVYSARIGEDTVTITSDNSTLIHFYSLQSKSCSGDNKVHYQDNSKKEYKYQVHNNGSGNADVHYSSCSGYESEQHITVAGGTTSECFFAFPGEIHGGDITITQCSPIEYNICDNDNIFLQIESCSSCPSYACYDPLTDTSINPYTYGLFGNWRSNKSYVYYGERMESDPTSTSNIRSNGLIKGFMPYWAFDNGTLKASTDTVRWVWNAESTLFNKKGYELENKDPLGRYNSGQYGYNQTLPISVTQNSKYREQFFDGFEDYSFNNENCDAVCTIPRSVDFTAGGLSLDTTYRHTGKYSLKLNPGDSDVITVPVIPVRIDTITQKILADLDIKIVSDTIVNSNGNGSLTDMGTTQKWKGYIQPEESGNYTIVTHISGTASGMLEYEYGIEVYHGTDFLGEPRNVDDPDHGTDPTKNRFTHFLLAGQRYSISINAHVSSHFTSSPTIQWQKCDISLRNIPTDQLYDTTSADSGVVVYAKHDCSKLNSITTDSSSIIKSFTPTQNTKFWLSAWVREDQDCLCDTFANNQIVFLFKDSSNNITSDTAKPSGNIIDGWQRYDKVINIPLNTVSISYKLRSTGAYHVYFDDIRIHPFNANMKSFVYDPTSMRLMAELDENNYATFYEYDDDGTLIRVKKETQRGIQTIKETRSYLTNK
jgi:hypothetical protein